MKKTLFFVGLIACASQLKAQQRLTAPPNNNSFDKLFKLKPLNADSGLAKFIPVLPQKGITNNFNSTTLNTNELIAGEAVYSRMPVVKTYSNDLMPVVKTDQPGMQYHMLIKRMDIVSLDSIKASKDKVTP